MELETIFAILKMLLNLQYFAIWLAMFLDATISPIPGETILVFAGYLIYLGQLNMFYVALAAALGTTVGAWVIYELSRGMGEAWLLRYGKWFVSSEDIERTKHWFKRRGHKTTFFGRFIPMISQLVSIPAGLAKMPRWKFLLYTFAGSFLYNALLTFFFYLLGREWEVVLQYLEPIQMIVGIVAGVLIVMFLVRRLIRRSKQFASFL
jgi:membrane protein DedA with SNARE-associated domain